MAELEQKEYGVVVPGAQEEEERGNEFGFLDSRVKDLWTRG
jgi:hypothetical protein